MSDKARLGWGNNDVHIHTRKFSYTMPVFVFTFFSFFFDKKDIYTAINVILHFMLKRTVHS